MSRPAIAQRQSSRRAGYAIGAAVNGVLLYLIHVSPGWDVLPFLTPDMSTVLPWIDASLAAGIAVNLVQVVADPEWLRRTGALVISLFGLLATVRLLQVFPFAFTTAFDWALVVRILLILGVVGSAIAVLVALISLRLLVAPPRGTG